MTASETYVGVVADSLPMPPKKSQRNMGVELFRVVSMMLVVMLHILGQGKVLSSTAHLSINYKVALFLQVVTYCSVNCYAMISGFANIQTRFKFRRFFYLWLETVFLLALTTVLIHFFVPSVEIKREWWLNVCFPLIRREYWYLCAYFLMFPLIPVLNKGLESLTRGQHILVIISLQLPTWFRLMVGTDNYVLGSGYSAIWLICLYVIGAYFRLYGAPKWAKWYVTLPVFFLAAFVAFYKKLRAEQLFADGILDKSAEQYLHRGDLISYISPCMVIMATMLLLFFMQVKVKGKLTETAVSYLGKSTWGVFVIHVSAAFWYWRGFRDYFKRFADDSAFVILLEVIGATVVVYLGLSLLSIFKILLFKYCRINPALEWLCNQPAKVWALVGQRLGRSKTASQEKP